MIMINTFAYNVASSVEVFKTDILRQTDAEQVAAVLHSFFRNCRISFDLEDCDRVLRVQGEKINTEIIISLVQQQGFNCRLLEN
jgi:hypothetical protein